jgi:hypothetical protein
MYSRDSRVGIQKGGVSIIFNPFDVATKELVWDDPIAWLRRLGLDVGGPVEFMLEGVRAMHQSTTYERILREGRLGEARRIIRRLGTQKYGEPDVITSEALEAIADVDRLEALSDKIIRPDITSWGDLLNGG